MAVPKTLFFTVVMLTSFLIQIQGADKYTDGNRPYEFGFKIDGEQHRKEKKDENGLIMGEFGFITADGVYHVTVYATDEQGRFKILSMKNIRVKPYPTYTRPGGSARQGHSLDLQTPQQSLPQGTPLVKKSENTYKKISIEPPAKSCSSCSLPTTTTQAPATAFVQPNVQNTPSRSNTNSFNQNSASPNIGSSPNYPANQQSIYNNPRSNSPQSPSSLQNSPELGFVSSKQNLPNNYPRPQSTQLQGSKPDALSGIDKTSGRTAKKYDGDLQQSFGTSRAQPNGISDQTPPNKPTLISAQMQIVDKNTDIYRRGPGEKEGLPNGLTKGDMTQLLYTFNYTVGFHGHFEEGYRNGAKQGYYYVTGRNGVRTRVDYVADENGFRPKITQEVLDLLSEDVPKPETEKDEKYGLKGYEFKWLYYPVESNRR